MAHPNLQSRILPLLGPTCRDDQRRVTLVDNPTLGLDGLDYAEYDRASQTVTVHFLQGTLPPGAYGLPRGSANFATIRIEGGTRIVGVKATDATADYANDALIVTVSEQGDFSPYWLSVGWFAVGAGFSFNLPGIDRQFSIVPVNFRPSCDADVDCESQSAALPLQVPGPLLDYQAKDYASFRAMLLDLVSLRNPHWIEQHAADLGIELLELIAYEGDALSYFQDAVANEATLDTARKRISAKRHARLVDYRMHDGRNAWTYAQFAAGAQGQLPAGTRLVTGLGAVPAHMRAMPTAAMLDVAANHITDSDLVQDPAFVRARIFETTADLPVDPLSNELVLHTWGNAGCCLPAGATLAHVFAIGPGGTAVPTVLRRGDWLVLEEVRNPVTGAAADADPSHRVVVQITNDPGASALTDAVFDATLLSVGPAGWQLQPPQSPASPRLPLQEIHWDATQALPFELCLSAPGTDPKDLAHCTVARGNTVVADHGITVSESHAFDTPVSATERFELKLLRGPLTMSSTVLDADARAAVPAVTLAAVPGVPAATAWKAVPDLLESHDTDTDFVVDVDDDGRGILRFGDDDYGRSVAGAASMALQYRIGNGIGGNIGANALRYVLYDSSGPAVPAITGLTNPLPARGGVEPETVEAVRTYAPAAFHAVQYRAVTEADYTAAALTVPGVQSAVAAFRWTGSWFTVLLGIEPGDPANLITEDGGRTHLDPQFADEVAAAITRYRLAGYDLEVRAGEYVPLRVDLHLCVNDDHFRSDVVAAVTAALVDPGFFAPQNFSFGQSLPVSSLYAAVSKIDGVDSVEVTALQRYDRDPAGELAAGVILAGPWQILRLDNDPSRPENGVLTITADGGK